MIYIGNSNTFKGILNKEISDTDLTKLYENLVKSDVVNFSINSVGDGFYPVAVRAQILTAIQHFKRDSKVVILNDKSLHLYKDLTAGGFSNILLVYGKWKAVKKGQSTKVVVDPSTTSRDIMRLVAKSNFKEFQQDTSNIISLQEFMNMSDKFDLIIANPPFSIGNKVITKCLDKADQLVVLMPLKEFRTGGLFEHITSITQADSSVFQDANITKNLSIALLDSKAPKQFSSKDDFNLQSFDPALLDFYKLNLSLPQLYKYDGDYIPTTESRLCPETAFVTELRACADGVHRTQHNLDYHYNVLRDYDNSNIRQYRGKFACKAIYFPTKTAKDNFCLFWYSNPLMHKLLKGLNKNGGSFNEAIPRIDFNFSRDYEHLTYEELLRIMREELSVD